LHYTFMLNSFKTKTVRWDRGEREREWSTHSFTLSRNEEGDRGREKHYYAMYKINQDQDEQSLRCPLLSLSQSESIIYCYCSLLILIRRACMYVHCTCNVSRIRHYRKSQLEVTQYTILIVVSYIALWE
jgi:hypothetical protein